MRPRNPTEDEYQIMLANMRQIKQVRGQLKGLDAGGVSAAQKMGKPAPSPRSPYKSKLEAAFAQHLDVLKMAREIAGWSYEPLHWRLPGKKNWYKSDFCAWGNIFEQIIFYEVKGRNKSDDVSLVKLKTAAALNPWAVFIQVKWINGTWQEREMTS